MKAKQADESTYNRRYSDSKLTQRMKGARHQEHQGDTAIRNRLSTRNIMRLNQGNLNTTLLTTRKYFHSKMGHSKKEELERIFVFQATVIDAVKVQNE